MNFNVKKSISAELNVILWKICALLYLCIRINWIWIKSACDDFHYSLKKILLKWNAEAEFQFKAETRKFSRCSYPKWSKSAIHHNPIKQIHMKTAARLITTLVAFRKRHFRILSSFISSRRLKHRRHIIAVLQSAPVTNTTAYQVLWFPLFWMCLKEVLNRIWYFKTEAAPNFFINENQLTCKLKKSIQMLCV